MYKASAFINGESIFSEDLIKVKSPLDDSVVGTITSLNEPQILSAFESAHQAFHKWKLVDYKTRIKYFMAFAAKIREHAGILARILHLETGKTMQAANDEIIRSADYIVESTHAYADLIEKPEEYSYENNILIPKGLMATYIRDPLGVVLTISPFNYPINLMITKIVPALLLGNSVVHKSAVNGSLSGWYLVKLFHELSVDGYLITPGVLNYVTGKGSRIGEWFLNAKHIEAISFTGSTLVGKNLVKNFSLLPKQLEMGGHNPAIVMQDADIDFAISEICKGAFLFSGQRCTSIKRVYVSKSIFEVFIVELGKKIKDLVLDSPLINSYSVEKLILAYEDALSKGAKLVSKELVVQGNFVTPVVLKDVSKDSLVYSEEIFAPILIIDAFEKAEQAIHMCNDSNYGLQASIFSRDMDLASDIALKLDFARINVNCLPSRAPDVLPFGGIKDSGLGVQGIKHSLLFFSRSKGVVVKNKNV